MTSRITIEIDFDNNNQPFLQILSRPSDDVRDRLIRNFLEQLGFTSSWCTIKCVQTHEGDTDKFQRWVITPVQPKDFEKEGAAMMEQMKVEKTYQTLP